MAAMYIFPLRFICRVTTKDKMIRWEFLFTSLISQFATEIQIYFQININICDLNIYGQTSHLIITCAQREKRKNCHFEIWFWNWEIRNLESPQTKPVENNPRTEKRKKMPKIAETRKRWNPTGMPENHRNDRKWQTDQKTVNQKPYLFFVFFFSAEILY